MDLQGKIKFGSDIELIIPPDIDEEVEDYWREHLIPDGSPEKMRQTHRAVAGYLPEVELYGLSADYVGIGPKLIPPGGGFQDFVLRTNYPTSFLGWNTDSQHVPMITPMRIESPGLSSCLAVAEMVVDILPQDAE